MNKNKLIVLLVLLVAVVGLTMGSVAAGSTTKTKYKVVKVKTKFNKVTSKQVQKYKVITYNGEYKYKGKKIDNLLLIQVSKKNKILKANKYSTKLYYKQKGKNKVTPWMTGNKKYKIQSLPLKKSVKMKKIAVKIPVSKKKIAKKSKSKVSHTVKIGKYKCKLTNKQYKKLKTAYKKDKKFTFVSVKTNKKYHKATIQYKNGYDAQDEKYFKKGFYGSVWDTRYGIDGTKIDNKRVTI